MTPPTLAILPDFLEEHWPSMDLCAEMLERGLADRTDLRTTTLRPLYRRRLERLPVIGRSGASRNADRLINRMRVYPRFAKERAGNFDFFHIVDHSYSQLAHEVPAGRVGVFCHDLDTFRCVLNPAAEPRPRWFRAMVRKILDGFTRAAVVFHTTEAIRRQILQHGLADESKLVRVPLGIAPEFMEAQSELGRPGNHCHPERTREGSGIGGERRILRDYAQNDTYEKNDEDLTPKRPDERDPAARPFLLHVGSCIPRKRIDVLLNIFAEARKGMPELRLVQAGGEFTFEHKQQINRLGINAVVSQRSGLTREALAKLYQRASLVLVPSDAEGFGLPLIEALACGASVVASDIGALREVGGDAVVYCPVADIPAWTTAVTAGLERPVDGDRRALRIGQAAKYSWQRHADIIAESYLHLANNRTPRTIEQVAV